MRTSSRHTRLLPAVFAIVLAAAACGGDSDDAGGEPDDTGGQSEEVAGETPGRTQLDRSRRRSLPGRHRRVREANPDVTVRDSNRCPSTKPSPSLTQQFAQGDPPDVAVGLPGIVRNLADQDLLLDLDDVWDTWVDDGSYTEYAA